MTRIWITATAAVVVAALATGIALGAPARTAGTVTFTASYSGKATVKVADQIADISADGTGTGAVIGASKITGKGKGDAAKQPCVPFTGTGQIAATSGATSLDFTMLSGSEGCGDEEGKVFSITARAKVTGGSGALAGATGTLKMTGVYNRGEGTFSIKLSGTLTTSGGGTAQKATTLKINGGVKNRLVFSKKALRARAGKITIVMKNLSGAPHNIAIRAGASAKSKIVAKGKVVRKGKLSKVTVTLKKGKYRFVCTVPGHEKAGMWGILTVT